MKIAFIWDFTVDPVQLYSWDDGLSMALKLLANKYEHSVKLFANDKPDSIYEEIDNFMPDAILCWGSLDRPSFAGMRQFNKPTALCFAGGPTKHPQSSSFDLIFVENDHYLQQFKEQGKNVRKAFGTNDYLFRPMQLEKKWAAIYPAAFANWKRHNLFAAAMEGIGLAVGKIIPEETNNLEICVRNNITVLPEVPYKVLPYLYNQSKLALIAAAAGSQRAVLEAMSCNIVPIVMSDATQNVEFVKDSGFGLIADPDLKDIREKYKQALALKPSTKGREYIQSKYSADLYAKALNEGLMSIK